MNKEKGMPIKIFVRIKPQDRIVEYTDKTITVYNMKNKVVTFSFDKVLGPGVTNKEIYKIFEKNIKKISKVKCLEDQNISEKIKDKKIKNIKMTILAYGQTGSGKTYTMMGTKDNPGLVYLLIKEVLKHSNIKASFIEIYNEKIIDLIDMAEKEIREVNGEVKIPRICEKEINNFDIFEETIKKVMTNRMCGETRLNKSSSRSHLVVKISAGDNVINLVDLAGSENNRRTGNEGVRMQESSNINRSLFVLNKVINAIINKDKRIPYRDSKLTRMLKEYIGGTGECFLIATVVDCIDESGELISTLNFATKSNKIMNIIETNEKKIKKTNNIFDMLSTANRENNKLIFRNKIDTNTTVIFNRKLNDLSNIKKKTDIENSTKIYNNTGIVFNRKTNSSKNVKKTNNVETNVNNIETNINDNHIIRKVETNIDNSKNCNSIRGIDSSCYNTINRIFDTDRSITVSSSTKNGYFTSLSEKNMVEMTPVTKKKSYKFFLCSAKEAEEKKEYKNALEIYKTIKKFADSEFINGKITEMYNYLKKDKTKFSVFKVLEILNSGIFIEIKKLNGIGDKRAQSVVDFISTGHFFKSINDLRMIFSEKIVDIIKESIES